MAESNTYSDLRVFGEIKAGKLTVDGAYSLPTVDGSANQVLVTDGAGNVSFQSASAVALTTSSILNGTGINWTIVSPGVLQGNVTLAPFTTDNLTEGSANLYYQDEYVDDRVNTLLINGTGITKSYNDSLNTLTIGVTLAPFSTTNLAEGVNLYYTDERVEDRMAAVLYTGVRGTGPNAVTWTHVDGLDRIYPTVSLTPFSTDDLAEGATNLYLTENSLYDLLDQIIQDSASVTWTRDNALNRLTPAAAAATIEVQLDGSAVATNPALDFISTPGLTYTINDDIINGKTTIQIDACIVGGAGVGSTLRDGNSNSATGDYSTVIGGLGNTAVANYSSILGGADNCVDANYSSVLGGECNFATVGSHSTVVGGCGNITFCDYASVVGGCSNNAGGCLSFVGGGLSNNADGYISFIGGGNCNTVTGGFSFVGGGRGNTVTGGYSFVGGGDCNSANSFASFVGGGEGNNVAGEGAPISLTPISLGPLPGAVDGTYYVSTTSSGAGTGAFMIITVAGGSATWTLVSPGVNYQNNDTITVDGADLGGSSGADDIVFTVNSVLSGWSATVGGSNNDSCGVLNFMGSGLGNFICGHASAIVGGSGHIISGLASDFSAGSTILGGDNNSICGLHSTIGGGIDNVISAGASSTIGGGDSNSIAISGQGGVFSGYSTIAGGNENVILSNYSTIAGGAYNTASGSLDSIVNFGPVSLNFAVPDGTYIVPVNGGTGTGAEVLVTIVGSFVSARVISGGSGYTLGETVTADIFSPGSVDLVVDEVFTGASSVLGGYENEALANGAAVGGGYGNTILSQFSTVGGGSQNYIDIQSPCAIIGGGHKNSMAGAVLSTIGGGTGNEIYSVAGTIAGGIGNLINSEYGTIGGGAVNTINGSGSTISGGNSNTISGDYSAVLGGGGNSVSGFVSTIAGGQLNAITACQAFIGSGYNNIISGSNSAILGGDSNDIGGGLFSSILGGYCNLVTHDYASAVGCNITSVCDNTLHVNYLNLYSTPPNSGTGTAFLVRNSNGMVAYRSYGGLFAQTANGTTVTATVAETSILGTGVGSLSVPANGFSVGDSFVLHVTGTLSAANNETLTIKLKSGTTTLATSGAITLPTITSKKWNLDAHFTVRAIGAAGVAQLMTSGSFTYNQNSGNSLEGSDFESLNTTNFDTTASNTLSLTVQWGSTNATNSIATSLGILEKVF